VQAEDFDAREEEREAQCANTRERHSTPGELAEFLRGKQPDATENEEAVANNPDERNGHAGDLTCPALIHHVAVERIVEVAER